MSALSSAAKAGSALALSYSTATSSTAATSASGMNLPPNAPKYPSALGIRPSGSGMKKSDDMRRAPRIATGDVTVCAMGEAPRRPVGGRCGGACGSPLYGGGDGRGSLRRGPRAPSHAVDLSRLVTDDVPHPPAVHTPGGGAAAA